MKQAEEDLMVMAAQQGNERAFEFLFRRYHAPLVRFAARMARDPELARDAVQEAWIGIARRLRRLDDPRAFRAWIFRAVRWQVLDRLKTPSVTTESLSEQATPAPDRDRIDQGRELAELIAGLPDLERQVLHQCADAGVGIGGIAA
ncbi:MAG: RNA polymerase sigma factor [Wenzhouxiangella sp.]|nr:RNA polymerase sigma factor [Wenzhouxiangella sp.]MCH8476786.1 RNA polymerase sigma factor [Wenzhouxiangella sp.]